MTQSNMNSSFESVSSTESLDTSNEVVEVDENTAVTSAVPDSSTSSNLSSACIKSKAKSKINEPVNWMPCGSYNSTEDFEKYIASHDCFYEHSRNETKGGTMIYYYCNRVIYKDSSRCPVKLRVFQSKQALTYGISVSTFVHNHNELKLKKVEFSQALKKEVYTMKMQFNMKPKLIAKHLQRNFGGEHLPLIPQIRAILKEQRKIEIPQTVSYGQLIEWCNAMSETPTDEDQSFILDHFYDGIDNSFSFVVTTLRLLRNAVHQDNVCADGTYKIVWQKFPLIIVGFVDRRNHFHVLCACLTSNERTNEYRFVFQTIKNAIEKHTKTTFEPNVLISDAAPAIRNGFYDTFESATQNVICFVHVLRNIRKAPLKNKANRDAIVRDIKVLHKSPNKYEFDIACDLFIAKWTQNDEKIFCDYLQSQWLQSDTQNWYCGYSPFVPAHNNCQEGFNNSIKRDHLMRELLPFDTFKIALNDMVCEMSHSYSPSVTIEKVKTVENAPLITNDLYRDGHQWINNESTILGKLDSADDKFKVFFSSSEKYENASQYENTIDALAAISCSDFESFDDYKQNCYRMVYRIKIRCSTTAWFTESTCCCSDFYSKYICKHIIGLAFYLKLKKMPKEAVSVLIEEKRSRGRAPKAKKALQMD